MTTFTQEQLESINKSTKLLADSMSNLEKAIYTRSKDIINQPAKMQKTPLEKLSPAATRLAEAVQKMAESPTITSEQTLIDIPEKTSTPQSRATNDTQNGGSNVYEDELSGEEFELSELSDEEFEPSLE